VKKRPTLWFCVPAHGRLELARICLRQLRRTCDLLERDGVDASAVVVADDENLDTARDLGFATVERGNEYLSAKFNDGLQAACDPAWNPRPVDYVVPCGTDDWVDHRLFLRLPPRDRVLTFHLVSFVREDGQKITPHRVNTFIGGSGIRVYPAAMLARADYRPADEDRRRGCDTSIFVGLKHAHDGVTPRCMVGDLHPFQIVDWKSPVEQLNTYEDVRQFKAGDDLDDPYSVLADLYPADALADMRALYASREMVAA
jgi:hypothetical protein